MQLDVSVSIWWKTAINESYNQQWVSVERYVTNLLLAEVGNLHDRQRHLSAKSAKLNILLWSGL
jgi:hypothetical protein